MPCPAVSVQNASVQPWPCWGGHLTEAFALTWLLLYSALTSPASHRAQSTIQRWGILSPFKLRHGRAIRLADGQTVSQWQLGVLTLKPSPLTTESLNTFGSSCQSPLFFLFPMSWEIIPSPKSPSKPGNSAFLASDLALARQTGHV